LDEVFLTYNNSIHSSMKLKPFELLSGRTHVFEREINFDTDHEYLRKLNAYQEKIYKVKEKLEKLKQDRTVKLNEEKEEPLELEKEDEAHSKENRKNMLTPRFTELTVHEDLAQLSLKETKKYTNQK